jgi:ribonuclease D
VKHQIITTQVELEQLCADLAGADSIAFDTEFVSEHTYRPTLCLVQVAAAKRLAVIDPFDLQDLTPFWKLLAAPGHETIVHAGREELIFCHEAVGGPPANLFDVQLAAGLVGYEYPAGYGTLLSKLLNETPAKGETRTDWRRRPLTSQQIEYALDDVRYLQRLRDKLHGRMSRLKRLDWLAAEMAAWQAQVIASRGDDRWRKVAGSSTLGSRGLAIVRELWRWREEEAGRRDSPVRRVLRDDLIVELAKRRTADPKRISAIRGLERGDLKKALPKISQAIERALALSDEECPRIVRKESSPQLTMVGQFLAAALNSICRAAEVAPSLVGTANDVRDLINYRLANGAADPDEPLPALTHGWRAEVVGQKLDDLLAGRLAIRIVNPTSDQPLAFESVGS